MERTVDAFTQGRVWKLEFSLVWRDRASRIPSMRPVDWKNRRAWAELIAGWLRTAVEEAAALDIAVWTPPGGSRIDADGHQA